MVKMFLEYRQNKPFKTAVLSIKTNSKFSGSLIFRLPVCFLGAKMSLYEEPEKLKQLDCFIEKIKNKFEPVAVLVDNYSDGCFSFDLFDNFELKHSKFSVTIVENHYFEIQYINKIDEYNDIQIDATTIKEIWHIIFYLIDKFNFNKRKHFNGRELFFRK
ncbi:MAG: hypothetical protein J6W29_07230 [Neisseriaceae bacterium]|nr:hypothetical protein [Neisseriaceae bacterium]